MKTKSDVLQAVKEFAKVVGAPDAIICDAAQEQKSESLKKFLGELGTTLRVLEKGTPWANKAELYIELIKEAVRKDMKSPNCPLAFWDYCVERRARVNNMTAKGTFQLHGQNAYTATTNEQGDISNLCQYDWYDWCYFRDNGAKFPFNKEVLGRILGPAKGEGNNMAQWILKSSGHVVPRRTSRPLTVAELHSDREQKMRDIFDALIERRWGTAMTPPNCDDLDTDDFYEEYEDDNEPAHVTPDIEDSVDATGRLLNTMPAYDLLLNAEVSLQLGDDVRVRKVTQQAIGPDGTVAGTYDDNPIMNTMIYDVEFPDGQVREYAANIIAENMLTQVDSDGYTKTLMESIVDYKKDEAVAVPRDDMYATSTVSGQTMLQPPPKVAVPKRAEHTGEKNGGKRSDENAGVKTSNTTATVEPVDLTKDTVSPPGDTSVRRLLATIPTQAEGTTETETQKHKMKEKEEREKNNKKKAEVSRAAQLDRDYNIFRNEGASEARSEEVAMIRKQDDQVQKNISSKAAAAKRKKAASDKEKRKKQKNGDDSLSSVDEVTSDNKGGEQDTTPTHSWGSIGGSEDSDGTVKVQTTVTLKKRANEGPPSENVTRSQTPAGLVGKPLEDEYGCDCIGIKDMARNFWMDKKRYDYYIVEGRFLHGNKCRGCETAAEKICLLPNKGSMNKEILVYCDQGNSDRDKCDCFYCLKCSVEQLKKPDAVGGRRRRRTA